MRSIGDLVALVDASLPEMYPEGLYSANSLGFFLGVVSSTLCKLASWHYDDHHKGVT